MTKITLFLFLLASIYQLVDLTARIRQSRNDISNRVKRDTVLIRSKRRWVLSTIDLEENMPGPYPLKITQLFNDKYLDQAIKFRIKGDGVTTGPLGLFTIDENTGDVFVHRPIDREVNPFFHVDFDVLDRNTGLEVDKTLSFNVEIKDKNDNAPVFTPKTIQITVPENTPPGKLQALQVSDMDQKDTPHSKFTMRLVSQEPALPKLSLVGATPEIQHLSLTGCFNYDKAKQYTVLVEAKDQGIPSLSSTGTVILDITESNTHAPEFTSTTYNTEVMEMESNKEILRLGVSDKDTPNTPASRAVFSIVKGNEEGYYKIETDPKTNEGVLYIIKGKNYEKTAVTELEIAVENEEKLFTCVNGQRVTDSTTKPRTTKVAVKVIDVNDPPVFVKTTETVYRNEGLDPGDVLFTPVVKDEDSDINNIRYELTQDPAKWLSIDPKTGKITTVQKMDRESPYVKNGTYPVVIRAIDDGQPPGTGTCTVMIYLGDVNDNFPYLISNNTVMCVNKADRVNIMAADHDDPPFGSPFSFSLRGDEDLNNMWKLDPTSGVSTTLISLTTLPYGNYSVPLEILDSQGLATQEVVTVALCDCGTGDVCPGRLPRSSRLGSAGIGLLFAGLLLLPLLLLFALLCQCGEKNFQHTPLNLQDEGHQTLVKYNEEGGGSLYKPSSQPMTLSSMKTPTAPPYLGTEYLGRETGYRKGESRTPIDDALLVKQYLEEFQDTSDGGGMYMPYQSWSMARTNTVKSGRGQMSRSYSVAQSDRNLAEHINRKVYLLSDQQQDYPVYTLRQYEYEGNGSDSQSLDQLSVANPEDNLDFLQNLGPKFNSLGRIGQQAVVRKNMQL